MEKEKKKIVERFKPGAIFEGAEFDDDALIVRNVTLLGPISMNGHTYTEEAMREAAVLFEGIPQYIDHPAEEGGEFNRSVRDLFSKAHNVRYIASENKVRGDMHLVDTPEMRKEIAPRMKHFKEKIGNSHVVFAQFGEKQEGSDMPVIAHITDALSVDLVTDPATTKGLFEGIAKKKEDKKQKVEDKNKPGGEEDMKELTLEKIKKENPELFESMKADILKESEDAAKMDALIKERDFLKKDNEDKDKKLEVYEVKEAEQTKKELIDKLVSEAKLPETWVTPKWLKGLQSCKDEVDIKEEIKERQELIAANKPRHNYEHDIDLRPKVKEGQDITDDDIDGIVSEMKSH